MVLFSPYTAFLPFIYIVYRVLTKKESINRNPWNLGLLILFVWSLISGIINRSLVSTVLSVAFFMYFCLSVYLENNFNVEEKIENLYRYVVYFSIIAALFGIFEKVYFNYFDNRIWKSILGITYGINTPHRIYSTFGNPNVAGTWFAAMVLISIYFCSRTNGKRKLFYQSSSILFIAALLLTGSRGADMGLLAGLIAYFFLRKNSESFKYLIVFFILFAVVVLLPSQIIYAKNLMGHELNSSFNSRNAIWDGCIRMLLLKPVTGWGLMGIYDHGINFMDYHTRVYHGHNTWVTIATTLGFVGLSVFIFMKFYLYAGLKTLYNNNCNIAPLLAAIQVLILCHGFVDFTIITPQAGLLFIASSSFINSLAAKYNNSTVPKTLPALSQISLLALISSFINKPVFPAVSTLNSRTSISVMPNLTNRPAAPVLYTLANKNTFSTVTASKYKSFSKTG
jgi:O-antigen ligase